MKHKFDQTFPSKTRHLRCAWFRNTTSPYNFSLRTVSPLVPELKPLVLQVEKALRVHVLCFCMSPQWSLQLPSCKDNVTRLLEEKVLPASTDKTIAFEFATFRKLLHSRFGRGDSTYLLRFAISVHVRWQPTICSDQFLTNACTAFLEHDLRKRHLCRNPLVV